MNAKVVTFGEIMLRLSPPRNQRFVQATSFDAVYGGGEANVAVSLANYGVDAYFVTKVPEHEIGQCAVNALRAVGVHTDYVARGGDRLGIYFCELGASQRASKVIYDRANSAIAQIDPDEFDWTEIFKNTQWFHFTGITPALSDSAAAATLEAAKTARAMGVKVSADLNYRKKLWSPAKANRAMSEIMRYVDVVVANEEDAEKVFGISTHSSDVTKGQLCTEAYQEVAEELKRRFGFEIVAITLRESISASDNVWSGMLYDGHAFHVSRKFRVHIVDRVGGGDSFAGGLIYALLARMDLEDAVQFAAAASCLKHSVFGDFNLVNMSEVEALVSGDGSGRVQR